MNEKCQIIAEVIVYLDKHPDGMARIKAFLDNDKECLWSTADVKEYTGWGATHISSLCTSGRLPHIPGKPHKFVQAAVKTALEAMQTGGVYGRRRSKKKATRS